MTDIRFYHLQNKSLEVVLSVLLSKALLKGDPICIYMQSPEDVERMNAYLWTASPESFLPHGSVKDKVEAKDQPIFLTHEIDENPNNAKIAFLTQGCVPENLKGFDLVCNVFDGRDQTAVESARTLWKTLKTGQEENAYELTYWQQSENGQWVNKA